MQCTPEISFKPGQMMPVLNVHPNKVTKYALPLMQNDQPFQMQRLAADSLNCSYLKCPQREMRRGCAVICHKEKVFVKPKHAGAKPEPSKNFVRRTCHAKFECLVGRGFTPEYLCSATLHFEIGQEKFQHFRGIDLFGAGFLQNIEFVNNFEDEPFHLELLSQSSNAAIKCLGCFRVIECGSAVLRHMEEICGGGGGSGDGGSDVEEAIGNAAANTLKKTLLPRTCHANVACLAGRKLDPDYIRQSTLLIYDQIEKFSFQLNCSSLVSQHQLFALFNETKIMKFNSWRQSRQDSQLLTRRSIENERPFELVYQTKPLSKFCFGCRKPLHSGGFLLTHEEPQTRSNTRHDSNEDDNEDDEIEAAAAAAAAEPEESDQVWLIDGRPVVYHSVRRIWYHAARQCLLTRGFSHTYLDNALVKVNTVSVDEEMVRELNNILDIGSQKQNYKLLSFTSTISSEEMSSSNSYCELLYVRETDVAERIKLGVCDACDREIAPNQCVIIRRLADRADRLYEVMHATNFCLTGKIDSREKLICRSLIDEEMYWSLANLLKFKSIKIKTNLNLIFKE